jgi:hypothetical protein
MITRNASVEVRVSRGWNVSIEDWLMGQGWTLGINGP